MRRLSLRLRLTLAFALASALLLGAVGSFIFLRVKSGLDASLDASLRNRSAEFTGLARREGIASLRRALALEGDPAQLLDADGRVLAASPRGQGTALLTGRRLESSLRHEVRFERHEAARLLARPVGSEQVLVVSTSMVQRERALESLGGVLLIGGPLILLVSSGAGYLVASGALRPVERMRRGAAAISAATSDASLPLPATHDEIHRLGETLNAMLGRLASASAHEREFLATASHELRTPLAILRTEVELALEESAGDNELRPALDSMRDEIDRLARLAEDLLVIARGASSTLPVDPTTLDLQAVVANVIRRFAQVNRAAIKSAVHEPLPVRADELRLQQALGNMIDNALRHGAAPITVAALRNDDGVEIHVTDRGAGFTAAELSTAFDRAAGGRGGGFGLGLAIVDAIAQAHGGQAHAANANPGADVWITLPAD